MQTIEQIYVIVKILRHFMPELAVFIIIGYIGLTKCRGRTSA